MDPCSHCGSSDLRRVGSVLTDDTGRREPRAWVRRRARRGVTLSTLGRLIVTERAQNSPLSARLAASLPPPPLDPSDASGELFAKLAPPVLLLGAVLAWALFDFIVGLPVSFVTHMILGLTVALGPVIALGVGLMPSSWRYRRYLRDLDVWDARARRLELAWVCTACGKVREE
jgi:hypothetical protein